MLLAQDGVRLDDDATMLLLRYVVKLGCEPSAVGSMVGGISPQDPLFFVLHPMFEKALHVLWMSPKFRDSYSFEWEDGSCTGSKLDDSLPFTGELSFSAFFWWLVLSDPRFIPFECNSCSGPVLPNPLSVLYDNPSQTL